MCTVFGCQYAQITPEEVELALEPTKLRGPDAQKIVPINHGYLGFQRLSIMGLSKEGMQPFELNGNLVVCNGEIYGFRKLKEELEEKGYHFRSQSDCEILLPLFEEYGLDMFSKLDAEFACIIYDKKSNSLIAARDPIGIRPLYYGYRNGGIVFASEPKNLMGLCQKIKPFPPGHYYYEGNFYCYDPITEVEEVLDHDLETVCKNINQKLKAGIKKRLDSDASLGFLLSGGLDSSLVCAIAARELDEPIETYAIGMQEDAIDLKYARQVADYIGSNHHEVMITQAQMIDALEKVIREIATYDVTTIRASLGMYLICEHITENSPVRVLLTGEISDELFGYKYTDFAPDAAAFQKEAIKRINEIHMYDVLRADRCISSNSLEARVPFGDLDFVRYVMAIDPEMKMNRYGIGKYLLRHAFEQEDLLPASILFRQKAAFSDAMGHSLADELKAYAETVYSDEAFESGKQKYKHAVPYSKEALLYRDLFEKYYPDQSYMVKDFWMPNQEWPECQVQDPSARYLPNYGQSGQ